MDILLSVLLTLALLFFFMLSFYISGGEVSLFSLGENDLKKMQGNSKRIKYLKSISGLKDILLATILLINNFANISIVVISAYISENIFDISLDSWAGVVINVILVTSLILVFGEIVPKTYAQLSSKKFSLKIARPLYFTQKVLYPFSWLLYQLSNLLLKKKAISMASLNRQEFDSIIDFTKKAKEISDEEKKMLGSIQRTIDIDCRKIMTPKVDIFAIAIDTPFEELLELITSHGYSRIPIYKDSIDHIEGILYVKDLLPHMTEKNLKWQKLIKNGMYIPTQKKVAPLLKDFLSQKKHMAIIVDEFNTVGLITLEDIVEEVVGEIRDEFDAKATPPYFKLDKNTFVFDGKTSLIDFYRFMDLDDNFFGQNSNKVETLAGLMLELSSNMPAENKPYPFNNLTLSVETKENHRIEKVRVVKRDKKAPIL